MRYYKVNNQYLTYDTLHNELGYTRTPTEEIEWVSTGDSTHNWGDYICDGYSYLIQNFIQCTNFADMLEGWFSLNTLAINYSIYPSIANTMVFVRGGVTSQVASLPFSDEPRYLIKEDLFLGWMTEQEYTRRGWQLPNYLLLNKTTGELIHASEGHALTSFKLRYRELSTNKLDWQLRPSVYPDTNRLVIFHPYLERQVYVTLGRKYYKLNVTNSTIIGNLSGYWNYLYANSECTENFYLESNKRYEPGWYDSNNEWHTIISDLSDMPSETVRENYTEGYIFNSDTYSPYQAMICFVSNFNGTSMYSEFSYVTIRIYNS